MDPAQCVQLARKAVDLEPNCGTYWNTLGAAYYRAGQWQDAVAALEKSMQMCSGGDSWDWFFLAMAHWQLGDADKARDWYARAAQWMDKNQPHHDDLGSLRARAAALLGIEEQPLSTVR
jgi:uncharacterized protein HemY